MSTESSFKKSLKNFQLSRGNNSGISLPTNIGSSAPTSAFQSFRDSAANAFSSVTSTVQGYNPLGSGDIEEEDPWYQLSRVEVKTIHTNDTVMRTLTHTVESDGFCFVSSIGCRLLCFVGSILILVSVALLRGPLSHIKHMLSKERLPFTVSYVGSMILTLYAALGLRVLILTIVFAIIQIIALIWYVGSYIPGGVSTLRYGTAYIGRRAVSVLPI
ncbi:hypothetical protein [Parasitella parasitica]|uniref:Protein transport protein SFT2 n=1 Tax=Parasitella parasitica TaxID=35722 RepID=A0A0B7N254_9FUNG|nr:hypothetical protein [Parasitella parasitica]